MVSFNNDMVTNYFIIFLKIVDVLKFYWFLFELVTNIIESIT